MNESLFLDTKVKIDGEEKLAGMLTRLGDNIDHWPQEITQEAYKQVPYLSEFEPNVVLDKVDEERGFAYGSIEVRPATAMTTDEAGDAELTRAHIPIIVKEQMMAPFDVFMVGKRFEPLTEGRLRAALHRPETFDTTRARPYDPSLVHDLQPPIRAGYGGFGSGGTKMAQIMDLPLLPQLHGRVLPEHIERVKQAMADPSLQVQVLNGDEGVKAAFESAMNLEPTNLEKSATALFESVRPTVVQLEKLASGNFKVKWANADMFAPVSEEVPESVAQDLYGDADLVAEMEPNGTITASPDAAVKETMEAEEIKVADAFGLWKVQTSNGNDLIGWVFPNLLSMDMQVMPLALFTNGSQHAVQEHIAGEMAGKSTDLPKGVPGGYGCLYFIDHGTARAIIPMTIKSRYRDPDGTVKYMGEDDMGTPITFCFSEHMKKVCKVGEEEYIVPDAMSWMPLRGKTELVSEPLLFSKTASPKYTSQAEIVGDGTSFSFRGPAIAKLATDQTKFLNRADAEFLAVGLGMDAGFAKEALDRAAKGLEPVPVEGLRAITPAHEKMAQARADVQKSLDELETPIPNYFLAKEASLLADALTADKILGLGFINAENVSSFVDMLPALEGVASKLAELLVAVRLGLEEVPESAVERMMLASTDVIDGLKSLQQKEMAMMV